MVFPAVLSVIFISLSLCSMSSICLTTVYSLVASICHSTFALIFHSLSRLLISPFFVHSFIPLPELIFIVSHRSVSRTVDDTGMVMGNSAPLSSSFFYVRPRQVSFLSLFQYST